MEGESGAGGEVGEEFRHAGEGSARFEEVVLCRDLGDPFVISDWQLGPVEELEHALVLWCL